MTWVGTAPPSARYEEALTILARAILWADSDCDGVLIGPTTAFLVKGKTAVRCLLSAETKAAIARHVEGVGRFEPGEYFLEAPRGAEPEEAAAVLVKVDRADL